MKDEAYNTATVPKTIRTTTKHAAFPNRFVRVIYRATIYIYDNISVPIDRTCGVHRGNTLTEETKPLTRLYKAIVKVNAENTRFYAKFGRRVRPSDRNKRDPNTYRRVCRSNERA